MALTTKQMMFCEEYVANGYKPLPAYAVAFPDASEVTAKSNAYKLLKRQDCKDYIRAVQKERFDALNVSAERIAEKLASIAFADKSDTDYTPTSQLKALDLLQKQLGLQNAKVELKGKQAITINITEDEENDN